jgi:hypothetical protein
MIKNFTQFNENVDHILDKISRKEKISGYEKYELDTFSKGEKVLHKYDHCINYLANNYGNLDTKIDSYKSFGKNKLDINFNGETETYFKFELIERKFFIRSDIFNYLNDFYNFSDKELIEVFNEFLDKNYKSIHIKSISQFFINN